MKIKLLTRFRGAKKGSIHEVDDKAAKTLIAEKVAEKVVQKPKVVKKEKEHDS